MTSPLLKPKRYHCLTLLNYFPIIQDQLQDLSIQLRASFSLLHIF